MDYNQPVGGATNDPYVTGDPGTGTPGSAVPGPAVEYPQREIVHVIATAGLTPSNGDLTQLYQAIQAMIAGGLVVEQAATVRPTFSSTAQSGWLLMDDGTIGDATSGATHTGTTYQNLYTALWNSVDNTGCPVTGGRGGSAAADWSAHKKMNLPLMKGRAPIGAGTGSGLTARTLGHTGGEETHTLTTPEIPGHTHDQMYDASNACTYKASGSGFAPGSSGATGGPTLETGSTGGDGAHNNMQPWAAVNWEIKL